MCYLYINKLSNQHQWDSSHFESTLMARMPHKGSGAGTVKNTSAIEDGNLEVSKFLKMNKKDYKTVT